MKLEPNMYVRTLFGIKKIDHIDNKKTGELTCKYKDLINFLKMPYISFEEKKQK